MHTHIYIYLNIYVYAAAAAKSLQSCPTLCDLIDSSHWAPPSLGLSRQEHWNGLPFPSPMHARMLSHFSRVRLCLILWTAAHQALLSLGFSRQEYWSGLPFPLPGDLLNPGFEPGSPALQGDSLPSEPPVRPRGFALCSVTANPSKRKS